MAARDFRPATKHESEQLSRSLIAVQLFGDADELAAAIEAEPWRLQVNERGDVAVLGRWREHLPVLAIEALWCPASLMPEAVARFRSVAGELGLTDVVSPPTPIEEKRPYERAGMHPHTIVATLTLKRLAGTPAFPVPLLLSIRSAGHRDIPALLAVDEACFEPFWHYDARHLARFCASGRLAIAERAGEAVGYTLCTINGEDGLLGRLCVLPEWRRQGIGAALLLDAVRHTGEHGGVRVTLSTQVDNEPSHALYRKAAFHDTGRRYAFMRFGTDEG